MRVRARPGAGTRLCRSRAPCACASAVQMANLIRDWHCFLGDEPKDVDREIRCETYALPSCAPVPVAPPCACVGIMTCSTWLRAACFIDTFCSRTYARTQHAGRTCARLCMCPQCMRSSAQENTDAAACQTCAIKTRQTFTIVEPCMQPPSFVRSNLSRQRQPACSLAFESLRN